MKSLRDSCCRKHFNVEWMWRLVTNRQQIEIWLYFLVVPKALQTPGGAWATIMLFVLPQDFVSFFALPLTPFLWVFPFLIFLILFPHFIFIFFLLFVVVLILPVFSHWLLPAPRPIPPLCFILPCFLALLILRTCAVSKEQRWVTLWEIPSLPSSLW